MAAFLFEAALALAGADLALEPLNAKLNHRLS